VTAIRALQQTPIQQAAPALVEALDAPWHEVYSAALEAIGAYVDAFGDDVETMSVLKQAIPEVRSLLLDDSTRARRVALHTLGVLGDPVVVQDVAHLLQDRKSSVRLAAVEALTAIGGEEAIAALRAMLDRTEEDQDLHAELLDAIDLLTGGTPAQALPEPV
jgi:HEAT repeat protein